MQHEVIEVSLANGIKGLFIHSTSAPVMTFDFSFRGGDFMVEDKNKWEAAHLMEHVVPQANATYPKGKLFHQEIERNGALANAYTDSHDIGYDADCADFEWERIFTMMLDSISKPLFLKDEFEGEMGNVREELAMRSNNHFSTLILNFLEATGDHVITNQERLKRVGNVELSDVVEHYKRTHYLPNLRFVIGGNLTTERQELIMTKLEALELPTEGKRIEVPDVHLNGLDKPLYVDIENQPDNVIMIFETFLNRRMTDPETDALAMVNAVLTGGMSSRILSECREKGILYCIDLSGHTIHKGATGYGIGIQVQPENIDAVTDIIVREYKRILDGTIDDADADLARSSALGRFQMSNQTIGRTASWYTGRFYFDDVVEDFWKVPEDIKAVKTEDGIRLFREMFTEKSWAIGFYGPIDETSRNQIHGKFKTLF